MSTVDNLIYTSRDEIIYKIIVLGDPNVGKTTLLNNFLSKRFEENYIPTVGVNILKEQLTVSDEDGNNILINLMFWDIAGQPQFYMLHHPYFNGADGIILIFDITCIRSFFNINKWYNSIIRYGLNGIPRILIGNTNYLKYIRKVPRPMAELLSKRLNAPYFETSAITGRGIKVIFQNIADLIFQSKLTN